MVIDTWAMLAVGAMIVATLAVQLIAWRHVKQVKKLREQLSTSRSEHDTRSSTKGVQAR